MTCSLRPPPQNKVFQPTWRVVRTWVDDRTAAKARVFGTDYAAFLEDHVGRENLSADLGGVRGVDWPLAAAAAVGCWAPADQCAPRNQ